MDIASIKAYKDLIFRLTEDDEPAAPDSEEDLEPAVTPDDEPDDKSDDQPDDNSGEDIENIMTEPKGQKTISLTTLAADLGLKNPDGFKQAFDNLKSGQLDDQDSKSILGDAFAAIMSADASTTQRVVNRLRAIYRKQLPNV